MKVSELQEKIFAETGLKTSVKKQTGSMKHHYAFTPLFQNGEYPKYPIEWGRQIVKQFQDMPGLGNYFTNGNILDILALNFTDYDPIQYKKERKPKPIDPDKPLKGWGSKNSQVRLDKAASRYAKALRRGESRARYY